MITLINTVTVTGDREQFREANTALADYMSQQPGARRFQLLQAADDPDTFVEVAEWESPEHHRAAVSTDDFLGHVRKMSVVAKVQRATYQVLRTEDRVH